MSEKCVWIEQYNYLDDEWETGCRNLHAFMEGDPGDNDYKFCPYCGRQIEVKEEAAPTNPQPVSSKLVDELRALVEYKRQTAIAYGRGTPTTATDQAVAYEVDYFADELEAVIERTGDALPQIYAVLSQFSLTDDWHFSLFKEDQLLAHSVPYETQSQARKAAKVLGFPIQESPLK